MNYRRWKKEYKKAYGYNPGILVDKRKRTKVIKRFIKKVNLDRMVKIFRKSIKRIIKITNDFLTKGE